MRYQVGHRGARCFSSSNLVNYSSHEDVVVPH